MLSLKVVGKGGSISTMAFSYLIMAKRHSERGLAEKSGDGGRQLRQGGGNGSRLFAVGQWCMVAAISVWSWIKFLML